MDWNKLNPDDLNRFLTINGCNIENLTLNDNFNDKFNDKFILADKFNDKFILADKLFNKLNEKDKYCCSFPIIDLYIASLYKSSINKNAPKYSEYFLYNLSNEKKQELANIFSLDLNSFEFNDRLTRILNFLGLINYSYINDIDEFLINKIMIYMDYTDVKEFYKSNLHPNLSKIYKSNEFWNEKLRKICNISDHNSEDAKNFYIFNENIKNLNRALGVKNYNLSKDEQNAISLKIHLKNYCKVQELTKFLKTNMTIKNLDFSSICIGAEGIGNEGVKLLANVLETNKTIKTIDLLDNNIGNIGVEYLSNVLKITNTLTNLRLSYNMEITNVGMKHISDFLMENKSLKVLGLGKLSITTEGWKSLANALILNTSLLELRIAANEIGDTELEILSKALKINNTLKELNLEYNNITDKGIIKLVKILKTNSSLENIFFHENYIATKGFEALNNMLLHNNKLKIYFGEYKYIPKNMSARMYLSYK